MNLALTRTAAALVLLLAACSRPAPTPEIRSFTADPTRLTRSGPVTLTWDVVNATALSLSPEPRSVDGTGLTVDVWATTEYVLTATGADGRQVTAKVTVTLDVAPLTHEVDPSIAPAVAQLGETDIASLVDGAGVQSDFALDEVRVSPRSAAELESFLTRVGGTVIGDDSVPAPPAALGRTVDPQKLRATEYLVRVDPSQATLDTLAEDAQRLGIGGALRFSSERARTFFAWVTREAATGLRVWPDFVHQGHAVLWRTQERATAGGFDDAFNAGLFPRYQSTGSRSNVVHAWQWVSARGIARRVQVAIIDSGFWLDGNGAPFAASGDGSDLPAAPTQYDFVGDDFIASGMAAMGCGGGACPWHGNGSAGVAVGRVNDSAAAAGTGGTVADPMLFNINGRQQVTHRAVRTAVVWGADVVNMSFGGNCNLACRQYDRKDNVYADAAAAGVVLVASAGNSGVTTDDDNFIHPCINDGVICVGAVADEGNTRFTSAGWSSNFGGGVDIWAPTNLRAMADGSSANGLITFGGTSSSAPFISGVAAMLKAIDPALTSEQVRTVLRDTAWTDSSDDDVSHVVNALEAVRAVSQRRLPADRFEPNDAAAAAKLLPVGRSDDLNIHTGLDSDVFHFSLATPSVVTLDLTYPAQLGKLAMRELGLGEVNSCGSGALLGDSASAPAPGRTVSYRLPQGTYSLDLGSVTAVPYDLQLSATSLGGAALPPDSFEPNDSFATRRELGDGRLVRANLSSASDVDFYRFHSRGNFDTLVMSMTSEAEVRDSDVPLTLSLYDGAGNLVKTMAASADCAKQAVLEVPSGFWVVRVSGPGAGYYSLWLGSTGRQKNIVDIGKIFYLLFHPDEPVVHHLTEPREWVMVHNSSDYLLEGLQVDGPGVRAKLLDEQGTLLAEGVPRGDGQELRLPAASAERRFIVALERVGEDGAVVQSLNGITVPVTLQTQLR